ncbi:MAG: hypothetical protein C0592_14450 [Marinilabiliales bacterium]|nr:MAG: hypothetical protein C0592_14450 [Marinilabiliales bacterium]
MNLFILLATLQLSAQITDFEVKCEVEFFSYTAFEDDPAYSDIPAVKLVLTVTNTGAEPIPDLCVSNRSELVNLYINDTLNNPLSLYNGIEAPGEHLLQKGEFDVYEFWFFERDAWAEVFTVQWEYMNVRSDKFLINIPLHKIVKSD